MTMKIPPLNIHTAQYGPLTEVKSIDVPEPMKTVIKQRIIRIVSDIKKSKVAHVAPRMYVDLNQQTDDENSAVYYRVARHYTVRVHLGRSGTFKPTKNAVDMPSDIMSLLKQRYPVGTTENDNPADDVVIKPTPQPATTTATPENDKENSNEQT